MRSPNGQSCSVVGGIVIAIAMAGDTVWRCEDIFKKSIKDRSPVRFEFREDELEALKGYYPSIAEEHTRVKEFLNCVILMQNKMSYEISTIIRIVGTNLFSCMMVTESPVYD